MVAVAPTVDVVRLVMEAEEQAELGPPDFAWAWSVFDTVETGR